MARTLRDVSDLHCISIFAICGVHENHLGFLGRGKPAMNHGGGASDLHPRRFDAGDRSCLVGGHRCWDRWSLWVKAESANDDEELCLVNTCQLLGLVGTSAVSPTYRKSVKNNWCSPLAMKSGYCQCFKN